MTDLNEWRLVYPTVNLPFGTYASRFPFTKQVTIGTPDATTNDGQHPHDDGMVFGMDSAGGMTLTFELAIPEVPARLRTDDPGPWKAALDAQRVFTHAWRARSIRRTAGAVCALYNDDRQVVVFGRPRNLAPKNDQTRQGWTDLVCDFVAANDIWYGAELKSLALKVLAGPAGPFLWPITFPWATVYRTLADDSVHNNGNEDTWPTIVFKGPATDAKVAILNANGGVMWELNVDGALGAADVLTVKTAPWERSAVVNGKPANGRLSGAQLAECVIPPGTWRTRYSAVDPSGASAITLNYRDAFSSL